MEDYNALVTLASRLAESVLMDWDKEGQVKLAKEVACECHKYFNERSNMTHEEKQIHNAVHAELKEFEEFKELVRRMREAQYKEACLPTYEFDIELYRLRGRLESEVDEYLKKMEI